MVPQADVVHRATKEDLREAGGQGVGRVAGVSRA